MVEVSQPGSVLYSTSTDASSVIEPGKCSKSVLLILYLEKVKTGLRDEILKRDETRTYPVPILISESVSKMSSFVRQIAVYPFTMAVYFNRTKSSHPHRRSLLVVTPISPPFVCKREPIS